MNTAVIELMLQLPGLDKDMIVNVSLIFRNSWGRGTDKIIFPEVSEN
jgi:hypothetical protein